VETRPGKRRRWTSRLSPRTARPWTQEFLKHQSGGYQLLNWLADDADDTYLGIRTHGTCVFGAKAIHPNRAPAVLTRLDAADVIKDATARFTVDGRVGASGEMYCHTNWGDYSKQLIGWRIFAF
jgi:hypothetical protein